MKCLFDYLIIFLIILSQICSMPDDLLAQYNISIHEVYPFFKKIEDDTKDDTPTPKLNKIKPSLRRITFFTNIKLDSSLKEEFKAAIDEDRDSLFTFIGLNLHMKGFNGLTYLNFLNFASSLNKLSPLNSSVNYKKNVEEFNKNHTFAYDGKYIEYQKNITKRVIFGKEHKALNVILLKLKRLSAGRTSCGVVSTYNALVSLNGKEIISYPDLIKSYEESGIALDSYFGIAPTDIKKFFDNLGYSTVLFAGLSHSVNKMSNEGYNTFILTFLNEKEEFMAGVHTICVKRDGNFYRYFNNKNKLKEGNFTTVEEAIIKGVRQGGLISIIFIKKK